MTRGSMKLTFYRITKRQSERCPGLSKVPLHHPEKLLGINPVRRSGGRGYSTIYSPDNLFPRPIATALGQELTNTSRNPEPNSYPTATSCLLAPISFKDVPARDSEKEFSVRNFLTPEPSNIDDRNIAALTTQLSDLQEVTGMDT